MATMTRNLISLTALLFLAVGTFATVMIIFNEKEIVSGLGYVEYYQIGGALAGAVVIMFLVYLTSTSTQKSLGYKAFIIFILVVGLIAELVMINIPINLPNADYGKYALIVFNFLFRAYHLVGYIQEPWAEITFQTVNKGFKSVAAPIASSTPASAPKPQEKKAETPEITNFKAKFREIRNNAKEKAGDEIKDQGAWKIITDAIRDNQLTRSKLEEAAQEITDKDGNKIAGLTIPSLGGRRRHR